MDTVSGHTSSCLFLNTVRARLPKAGVCVLVALWESNTYLAGRDIAKYSDSMVQTCCSLTPCATAASSGGVSSLLPHNTMHPRRPIHHHPCRVERSGFNNGDGSGSESGTFISILRTSPSNIERISTLERRAETLLLFQCTVVLTLESIRRKLPHVLHTSRIQLGYLQYICMGGEYNRVGRRELHLDI